MQNRPTIRFSYQQYASRREPNKFFSQTFTQNNAMKHCICGNINDKGLFECFKCRQKVHNCVRVQSNRPQIRGFQCLSCLAKNIDLIYQPQAVLLETFYRTENIFEKGNTIIFQFNLKYEETKFPVEVRGLKGSKIQLAWPYQGQFYINQFQGALLTLRPLKSNSSRKTRKEECCTIQPDKLREGKNTLTFKIPKLDRDMFTQKFKYQQSQIYFIGIYSVRELSTDQILRNTLKDRRHEKNQTLMLINDSQLQIPTHKVKMIDPYTCQKIKFPVRGRYCKHLKPICLKTYIGFQKKTRYWKCPICPAGDNVFLNQPYVDLWFLQILRDSTSSQSVYIHQNGTYDWQQIQEKVQIIDSEQEQSNAKHVILQLQQSYVEQLQNIHIQSSSVHQSEHINLIDFTDDRIQTLNDQVDPWAMNANRYQNAQTVQNEQSLIQLENNYQQKNNYQFQNDYCQVEPIIEESNQFDDLQFPFVNDYTTPSNLQRIVIEKTQTQKQEFTEKKKEPQIYKTLLENQQQQQQKQNVPTTSSTKLVDLQKFRQTLRNKPKSTVNSIITSTINQTRLNSSVSQESIEQQRDKIIGNKRLIAGRDNRPTSIQMAQAISKFKKDQNQNFRGTSQSFGKMKRKNIDFSQHNSQHNSQHKNYYTPNTPSHTPNQKTQYSNKIKKQSSRLQNESKSQHKSNNFESKSSKKLKNENYVSQETPNQKKQARIILLKFNPIQYSKYVKRYCNIPVNPLQKKINEDLRKIFKCIF